MLHFKIFPQVNLMQVLVWSRGQQTNSSMISQMISIAGFVGHAVSVASSQIYPYRGEALTGDLYTNGHGNAPIKFY